MDKKVYLKISKYLECRHDFLVKQKVAKVLRVESGGEATAARSWEPAGSGEATGSGREAGRGSGGCAGGRLGLCTGCASPSFLSFTGSAQFLAMLKYF